MRRLPPPVLAGLRGVALLTLSAAIACDTKPAPRADSADVAPSMKAMAPDTMMQRVESTATARRADSAMKARAADSARAPTGSKAPARKPARKPDSTQLRDSAFAPKYEVDSTGKIRPITPRKRPF